MQHDNFAAPYQKSSLHVLLYSNVLCNSLPLISAKLCCILIFCCNLYYKLVLKKNSLPCKYPSGYFVSKCCDKNCFRFFISNNIIIYFIANCFIITGIQIEEMSILVFCFCCKWIFFSGRAF